MLISFLSQAQISGTITSKNTLAPIPFAKIILNNETEIVADIHGSFNINDSSNLSQIRFEAFLHRPLIISLDTAKLPLNIQLNKYLYFEPNKVSSEQSSELMNKVLNNKKLNNFKNLKYLSYTTYNKATFTPQKVEQTNKLLGKITKFFSLNFNLFKENQHFLILESTTERRVFNKYHNKEIIKGAKSTVLEVPSLFIQTTQVHAFTPYDDFITVSGKSYVSPLSSFIFHSYIFNIIDTIQNPLDTIYVVKYHPHENKEFDAVKGLMYINTKNYAVQYLTASPYKDKKAQIEAYQSYKYYTEENTWFPDRTETKITAKKGEEIYTATLDTYISNVQFNHYIKKKEFDDVILQYPYYANQQDEEFWKANRVVPLTTKDSNTYHYYNSVDQKKYIQRSLTFGENLYFGVLVHKIFDIDLQRILDGNHLEGVRIGLGVHTNRKFSDRWILGGYLGYGFKDQVSKGGIDATYHIRNLPINLVSSLSYDVQEAGRSYFSFNRYQYSSEVLRTTGIREFDYVTQWENAAIINPVKFINLKTSISIEGHNPSYDYQFRNQTRNHFNYTELRLGGRFAYGEQFIQLLDRKISTATPFPVFYLQFTKGLDNFLGGNYNYSKVESKIEYTVLIPNLGTAGIQLIGGIVSSATPYAKLFNGNGSLRKFSVVIHNTFETMKYNEFLNDKYISLFMSHNFGRIYFKSQYIKPSLLIVQNMGVGSLKHPEYQQKIPFKTMEKGYYESGMLLDNFIVIGLTGLKIGIGPGFFYRYGPYAGPEFKNNFVVKLSTKFSL